jgi:YVTN family beta-propeller protein
MSPHRRSLALRAASLGLAALCLVVVAGLPWLALTPAAEAQAARPAGTLWVTNARLNDVTAFDVATGRVLATIQVGARPIGVVAPPRTGKVYVANEDTGTVTAISRAARRVLASIPTGPRLHHLSHSANGRFVYVAEFGRNTVGVIDTISDRRVAELTAGPPETRSHMAWPSADAQTVYVANSGSGTLAAVDARTGAPRWSLPVGDNPSEVIVSRDGRTAYVTIRNENKLKAVHVATQRVIGEAAVGTQPDTLVMTPDGRWLVIALRGSRGTISLVDVAGGLAVTPVPVGGMTTGHNALSTDGRFSYVIVLGDTPGVAVVEMATRSVVATYVYPGGGEPHGIYFEPLQAGLPQTGGAPILDVPLLVAVSGALALAGAYLVLRKRPTLGPRLMGPNELGNDARRFLASAGVE